MPDPKDCEAPTIVKPTKPKVAEDADKTDPGQVEELAQRQKETGEGKYGKTPIKAHKKDSEENKDKKNWVEVHLINDEDEPVPGAAVEIELPDGSVASGSTNAEGKFKVTNIDPGSCKITFVELDEEAWEPA